MVKSMPTFLTVASCSLIDTSPSNAKAWKADWDQRKATLTRDADVFQSVQRRHVEEHCELLLWPRTRQELVFPTEQTMNEALRADQVASMDSTTAVMVHITNSHHARTIPLDIQEAFLSRMLELTAEERASNESLAKMTTYD